MADDAARDTWRILDVLNWTRGFFESRGIESARLDAEVLLAHVLKMKRVMLYARFDQPLTPEEREAYRALVRRRAAREPVAYLVGFKEFWSLELEVQPGVLIPRPDSELLVQLVSSELEVDREACVVDVGTGSGALALAIATERPRAKVWATDLFDDALTIAQRNAERAGLTDRVTTAKSDLLSTVAGPFDVVVANLPYIPTAQLATLMPDVRDHEPHTALDGGPDGLDLIRRLIAEAPTRLTRDGLLILEAGSQEIPSVAQALIDAGYRDVHTERDLAGHLRAALAKAPI